MSSKYSGYMGKVMAVDLTTETVSEYPWSDTEQELYIGGKIMAARILADHLTGKETAFSEDNWIVISTGPLTGTGAPSSARFNISALSPQTGILASSNCGGSYGLYLKKAGYDALILKGQCRKKRWLEINEEQFIFHDADEL
ncbi:MAG: aldehyde:ferredoxin oxidoreductase, partial [Peptococcaceae bacterium]|nr:aldehyde:ferredoxin oxidoreductase [Peptococcaceae bacterium]